MTGTTPVRPGFEFDERALASWMHAHVAGFAGPLSVQQFTGGQSNPTYRIDTPQQRYVLRRKPPGQLLNGAHAVDREARILAGLGEADFPVPRLLGLCTDDKLIGTWFYVMEMVEGRIFWDAALPDLHPGDRAACFEAMNDTLARLHRVEWKGSALAAMGRPDGYFERQIARWTSQYLGDADAGRDPHLDRLVEWLPHHIPDQDSTAFVHGDFRIDNLVFHPSEPRVIAVLDWELASLGSPLADFTYHAMMYRMPQHIVAGIGGRDPRALGLPDEATYVARYCRTMGMDYLPHYEFAIAFSFFRLAAIFHGIKGRVMRGTAASSEARERVKNFPELAQLAWQQAERV